MFSELSGLGELKTRWAVVFHFGHSKPFSCYIWNRSLIVFYLSSRAYDPSAAWLFIMTYGHFPLPLNLYIVGNKFKPSPPRFYLFLLLKAFKVCGIQKEEATTGAPKTKDFSREISWRQVYSMDSLHPVHPPGFSSSFAPWHLCWDSPEEASLQWCNDDGSPRGCHPVTSDLLAVTAVALLTICQEF